MPLPTDFAPAERCPQPDIQELAEDIKEASMIPALNALPVPLLIINAYRQLVFCNSVFQSFTKCKNSQEIIGLRPGEALGCIHAHINAGGCGTSKFCRDCGAASAIIKSLQGVAHTEECRILRHTPDYDEALDLQVFTSPFKYREKDLILFTVLDITHEKRRKNLEHMFFHDVLNLATGAKYASQMLCKVATSEHMNTQCWKINRAITQMSEEILAQKDFSKAEEGTLRVCIQPTSANEILTHLRDIYSGHPLCAERQISLSEHSENPIFKTDPTILARVLGNMVKNALEASDPGEIITLGCRKKSGEILFWVHNEYVIPEKVQRQVFKRSFSTKGEGRGLGTYSMKLLVERYLGGQISFQSTAETGTIFSILLPSIEG
ncbi:sensor histidine kinase [Maridesulfovibrio sp.]|uniref:sensor histidine kinase n=1 Tax=Maridesulfovibrio sp. TaxID=2795000 RepID=UPI0039EE12EB